MTHLRPSDLITLNVQGDSDDDACSESSMEEDTIAARIGRRRTIVPELFEPGRNYVEFELGLAPMYDRPVEEETTESSCSDSEGSMSSRPSDDSRSCSSMSADSDWEEDGSVEANDKVIAVEVDSDTSASVTSATVQSSASSVVLPDDVSDDDPMLEIQSQASTYSQSVASSSTARTPII